MHGCNYLTSWNYVWLVGWLTGWPGGWLAEWLGGCLAGWQVAGWPGDWLAEFLKFIIDQILAVFNKVTALLQHYYSNMNAFKLVFSAKACFKVVVRSVKLGKPYY